MQSLRVAFFGSAFFSVPTLAALIAAGHAIAAIYTRPPKPAGRGHRLQQSPVHVMAEGHGLAVHTPLTLKNEDELRQFEELGTDAAVVAAYGLILPARVLAAPRLGCFNVHASLLPRWQGAAPIERAILAGDQETGITIIQMDEGLDTGPIVVAERVPIGPRSTASELHDTLSAVGARLMVEALEGVASGRLEPRPQPAGGATYARKLDRDEGRIDWSQPARLLDRAVRALVPRPGVWFQYRDDRISVLAAEETAGQGEPGLVLDDRLTVACGSGALRLLQLHRQARAPLDAAAFVRGFPLPPGTRLT